MVALGALVLRVKSLGLVKTINQMGIFQKRVDKSGKEIDSQFTQLTKTFGKFGLIAGGVFATLIAASPLLRARMEILGLRVRELVRVFGDALAPVIEFVTDLIKGLTDWFFNLDPVVQDAIVFGGTLVLVLGLLAIAFGILNAAMSPLTIALLALAAVAAILYLAWETNFLGLRDLVMTVFAVIGAVFEGIVNVVKAWFASIQRYVQAVIGIFEGIIEFIQAVFRGDLEGAIGAIQKVFENVFKAIGEIIMWPINAFKALIDGILGGDFINDIMQFGADFINAFIKGIQDAAGFVWGIIEDILGFLGDFFGGSLPERGPLKHVVSWGQDFGKAYVQSIGEGLEEQTSNITTRTFNIDTIALSLPGVSDEGMDSFADQFDTGVRRSVL